MNSLLAHSSAQPLLDASGYSLSNDAAMAEISADALKAAIPELHGAYGLAVISAKQPDRLLAARSGSSTMKDSTWSAPCLITPE